MNQYPKLIPFFKKIWIGLSFVFTNITILEVVFMPSLSFTKHNVVSNLIVSFLISIVYFGFLDQRRGFLTEQNVEKSNSEKRLVD